MPAGRLQLAGFVLMAAVLMAAAGCRPAGFYSQAVTGQIDILVHREPLSRLIQAPDTPQPLKKRLTLILEIRRFADTRLALPVGSHYLTYADLGRAQAVYAVFAAPEFSLRPKTWCYPIVGCAVYQGYFSEETAQEYADRLKTEGNDVSVAGIPAYSTLGWFNDPVLNTFVYWDPPDLAALIFHELAHQVLYVKDDTTFNESFAATVERAGVQRWLDSVDDRAGYHRFQQKQRRQQELAALVAAYRRDLEALYASAMPPAEMRARKATVYEQLRSEIQTQRQRWGGGTETDSRNGRPLNNAALAAFGAYHDLVPAFQNLLAACDGNLPRFYRACKRLADMPLDDRRRHLADTRALLETAG